MRHTSPRRKIVLLASVFLLVTSWASAAPRHGSVPTARSSGVVGIPDLLSLAQGFIAGGWGKEDCNIDPSGRCLTTLPTKEGCNIDPDGRCRSTLSLVIKPTDIGCNISPDGHCRP